MAEADRRDVVLPSRPTERLIRRRAPDADQPRHEVPVTSAERVPFQRVGRPEADITGVTRKTAAVDREPASEHIKTEHEIRRSRGTREPVVLSDARQLAVSGTQQTHPAVIDQQPTGVIRKSTQHRPGRHLQLVKAAASRVVWFE